MDFKCATAEAAIGGFIERRGVSPTRHWLLLGLVGLSGTATGIEWAQFDVARGPRMTPGASLELVLELTLEHTLEPTLEFDGARGCR